MQQLAIRKDPRALTPLIKALGDRDGKVRRAAAESLGLINDERAVDGLITMAGGWDLRDRVIVTSALLKIEQASLAHYFLLSLRVLNRPASIVYLLSVLFLAFVGYKIARCSKKARFRGSAATRKADQAIK